MKIRNVWEMLVTYILEILFCIIPLYSILAELQQCVPHFSKRTSNQTLAATV